MTALGAALIFLFRTVDKRTLDIMLGFAAGVMVAASFWSLLLPAIEISVRMQMGSYAIKDVREKAKPVSMSC